MAIYARHLIVAFAAAALLSGCTRERPTPEPATVTALPVAPVTTQVSAEEPTVVVDATATAPSPGEANVTPMPSTPTPAVPEQTFQYIVQEGDTLTSLAVKFATDVEILRRLNNLVDDNIMIGLPLLVPYQEGITAEGAPTPTPSPYLHVVQTGETLGDIALRYGVEPLMIVEANSLLDPDNLTVGMELRIPGYQPAAATTSAETGAANAEVTGGTAADAGEVTTHVVQVGETLLAIAETYGVDASELARANNISNRNVLRVGQELIIPGVTPRQAASLRGEVHVVKSGESLSQIAAQYGVTVAAIIEANELGDPDAIRVGQELVIPQP